ncbi:hypothetical protein FB451DRAFT_1395415 [Mycena latifolia]|nr:hypothetical protein FB451DRAFT_1395415 [Mycena latifolia]
MESASFIWVVVVTFCAWCRGALVNHTIEDFNPVVKYNCSTLSCDASATNPNPCPGVFADGANRTFTLTDVGGCQIKIPFTGSAVYAFLDCPSDAQCEFEIDDTGTHPNIRPTINEDTTGLSYFNKSVPNGTHMLVVTAVNQVEFDSVIYSFDDAVTQVVSSATSSSTISTSSPPTSSVHLTRLDKSKPPIAGIVGGILGGLVLIAVLAMLFVMFKRRSGHRKKAPGQILLVDPYPPHDEPADSSPPTQDNAVLIEQINFLQTELEVARRAQRVTEMKHEQTSIVRENASAAPAGNFMLQTEGGLRLEPVRQLEELPPQYSP